MMVVLGTFYGTNKKNMFYRVGDPQIYEIEISFYSYVNDYIWVFVWATFFLLAGEFGSRDFFYRLYNFNVFHIHIIFLLLWMHLHFVLWPRFIVFFFLTLNFMIFQIALSLPLYRFLSNKNANLWRRTKLKSVYRLYWKWFMNFRHTKNKMKPSKNNNQKAKRK